MKELRYKIGRWMIRPVFDQLIEVAYWHMKNGDTTATYGTGYWPGTYFGLRQLDDCLEHLWLSDATHKPTPAAPTSGTRNEA